MYFSFKEVMRKEKIFENEKLYENVFPRNFLLLLLLFFFVITLINGLLYSGKKHQCYTASDTLIQNHSYIFLHYSSNL